MFLVIFVNDTSQRDLRIENISDVIKLLKKLFSNEHLVIMTALYVHALEDQPKIWSC